jgi:hypothetical protein
VEKRGGREELVPKSIFSSRPGPSSFAHIRSFQGVSKGNRAAKVMEEYQATISSGAIFIGPEWSSAEKLHALNFRTCIQDAAITPLRLQRLNNNLLSHHSAYISQKLLSKSH